MIELNEKQKQAAHFMFGTASVVAIPGSGKTLTMAARITNLVRNGIPPDKILGLTFTKNAASEMRSRRVRQVLMDQSSNVTLSTIHSFCYRMLKEEGRTFTMLDGKRQVYLMRKVIKKLQVENIPAGFALREIGLAKSRLMDSERFRSLHEDNEIMQIIAQVYLAYEDKKRKGLCLDFPDLLMEAHGLLKSHEDRCSSYQQAFPHILVDEFQDTNPAQMEILNLLVGKNDHSSFWVCGDDWQSIFGFTGAEVENILSFSDRPGSTRFILDTNYRSTPQILTACQHLISHNERKIEKTLNTINPDGENIICLKALSEEDEAEKVVTEIRDLVESRGYTYRDIAVLYRANSQSRAIEEAFSRHNIPYRIESEANFYNRYEVNILLQYLVLIHKPDSFDGDESLISVINVPGRYVSHGFIEDLESFAEDNDLHLYPALKTMPVSTQYLQKNLDEFTALIDRLVKSKEWLEPAGVLEHLRNELDIDKYLSDELGDPFEKRLESLDQLQMAIGQYENLGGFLEYAESVRTNSGNDENGVTLSTVHKAKGLEFPVVFVIGMIDGVMPNANGDNEEERRIAFVALSRAMKVLYLSHSMTYLGRYARPSSFITEALNQRKEVVEK